VYITAQPSPPPVSEMTYTFSSGTLNSAAAAAAAAATTTTTTLMEQPSQENLHTFTSPLQPYNLKLYGNQ